MKDHRLKTIWTFLLFCGLSLSSTVQAFDVWSLPIERELKTLKITNLTREPQTLWVDETPIQLPAYGEESLPLNQFEGRPWIIAKTEKKQSLQLMIESSLQTKVVLPAGASTSWKVRLRPESEIVVFNQAPFEQNVSLRFPQGELANLRLGPHEKKRVPVTASLTSSLLTITGEARISGILLSPLGPRAWIQDPTPVRLSTPTEARYFRLTNQNQSQSFIVGLKETDQILAAEAQLQNPHLFLPRILIARVDQGHGEFNRDLSLKLKTPWSWHVAEVFRFAELASQECDGSPEMLEENLEPWLQSGGVICFWNYRIVEELTSEKVASGQSLSAIPQK